MLMSIVAFWVAFGLDGNVICMNTCASKGNGVCDDGGPDSEFGTCDLGTDCEDCGAREATVGKCEDDPSWTDAEFGNGQHSCKDFAHQRYWCTDFGAYSDAAMLACPVSCGLCSQALYGCECAGVNNHMGVGAECTDDHLYGGMQWCYVDRATCPNALQSEVASIQNQNLGFIYCGDVKFSDEECNDTCIFADDGRCDDGGAGSVSSACDLGTDCKDCGPRPGGGGPESTAVTTRYYESLSSCIAQEDAISDEFETMFFPAFDSSESVCLERGEGSEEVRCNAPGEVTIVPYTGGTQCGENGGSPQKERKWTHIYQQVCYEAELDGETVFARKDWEGRCHTDETIPQDCHLSEGKMKIKNSVSSTPMSDVIDGCLCSIFCASNTDAQGTPWAFFTWSEKDGTCQCFHGKLKKYKAKTGFFSGPL